MLKSFFTYLLATVAACLLAVTAWLFSPKEYAAQVKISDEYKETDFAVGLNRFNVALRDRDPNAKNKSQNDIRIYAKILDDASFAKELSKIEKVDVEHVQEHLLYNQNVTQHTLDIQYTASDPKMAACVLDSVLAKLQRRIWKYRGVRAGGDIENAEKAVSVAEEELDSARSHYVAYAGSHYDAVAPNVLFSLDSLKAEIRTKEYSRTRAYDNLVRQQGMSKKMPSAFLVVKNNSVPQESTTPLVGYLGVFITLALLLVKGIKLLRDRIKEGDIRISFGNLFAPWNITILVWAAILILLQFVGDLVYPVTSKFYMALGLWLPIFCVSSFLTFTLLGVKHQQRMTSPSFHLNINLFQLLLFLSLLTTPLCVKKVLEIVTMFGTEDLMANLRLLTVKGQTGLGVLSYSFVINKALLIAAVWKFPKIPRWQFILVIILSLLTSFVIMDKGTIFFLFSTVIFVLYEKKHLRLRSLILMGLVLSAIFFVLTIMRSGTAVDGSNNLDDLTFLQFFAIYVLTTPVAFCYLTPTIGAQYGSYTLTLFYLMVNKLGGNFPITEQVQEFVWVPLPTNLYTIMQPFYMDFGYGGIAFFALIYGVMCGWAYNKYKNGSSVACALYTFLLYYLILQFGQESLFMLPIIALQTVFFIFILTKDFRIKFSK